MARQRARAGPQPEHNLAHRDSVLAMSFDHEVRWHLFVTITIPKDYISMDVLVNTKGENVDHFNQ
jgi:hypothetical protein